MPTGYTCEIEKGITFKQFALTCARAFGACIEMREESFDTPIPDEFKPSTYHIEQLKKLNIELEKTLNMSDSECEKFALAECEEKIKSNKDYLRKNKNLRQKYEDMLVQVREWKPPNKDFYDFKRFMIEQIESSIRWDCSRDESIYSVNLTPLSAHEWRQGKLNSIYNDIAYHSREQVEEEERVAGRNRWIRELRESLK